MRNIKSYEPTEALLFTGRRVYGLAGLVLVLGIASYWWHVLAIIAMGSRYAWAFHNFDARKIADETRPAYFAARNDGLVVLDTIPNTIGAELKLLPGEIITKVNGVIPKAPRNFMMRFKRRRQEHFVN